MSSATISFGMVSIPVKLYSATEASAGVSFNLLHGKCGTRLKQQYICPTDNEIVPRDQMVKGYEFTKDRYVTFTEAELKALQEKASQAIDIVEFVPLDKVDPVYFEKSYYLGPDKGGSKAYRLLAAALEETKLAALAQYAARGKGYLVLLRPLDHRLVMQQLFYSDEIRPFSEVPVDDAVVKEQELGLAVQLIQQGAAKTFKPEAYHDEVRERELALIQKKVEGEEISVSPTEAPSGQIIDLMEALKASLAAKDKHGAAASTDAKASEAERKPPKRAAKHSETAEKASGKK
jgi:DNA end-binding protein Ku